MEVCGWKRVCDVTAESFIGWRNGQTLAAKTLNDYQHAVSSLLTWLKDTRRIATNPIEVVGRVDGRGRRTFERRAFTDGEIVSLLAVSDARRPIYLLAVHTGLRLNELRQLLWSDVDLDKPCIRLRAVSTKSRRADVLPLSPTAAAMLQDLRNKAGNAVKVFARGVPSHHTFKADMEAAAIPQLDERGHKVDFHALRTTFITNLQRAGVPQRWAMALARHKDPRLTAHVYTDTNALPLAGAVASLPTYGLGENAHRDAHGAAQTAVSGSRGVSHHDADASRRNARQVPEIKGFRGVKACHHVTRQDTAKQWSRGELNPRAGTVSKMRLRVCPIY